MRLISRAAAAMALAVSAAVFPAAHAQTNLLINGGFESGALSPGWSQFGDQVFVDVRNTGSVSEGRYSAWFGSFGRIAQTVSLEPGQYLVEFDVAFAGIPLTSFFVGFDGQVLLHLINPPASSPTPFEHWTLLAEVA